MYRKLSHQHISAKNLNASSEILNHNSNSLPTTKKNNNDNYYANIKKNRFENGIKNGAKKEEGKTSDENHFAESTKSQQKKKTFKNYNLNSFNYPLNKNFQTLNISDRQNYNNNINFNKNHNLDEYLQISRRYRKLSEVPVKNNFKFDDYFSTISNQNMNRNRFYSNNCYYFGSQSQKISPNDNNLKSNKYDNINKRFYEKAGSINMNLFSLWDHINSEKTTKKKWFFKSQNQINYGPFSDEEIYKFLKTTITTNPDSELLKNSMIIDSEIDIYFKPDSALEVIEQEIKDLTLLHNPKDELKKILIKVNKKENKVESKNSNKAHEELDALETNSNYILEKTKSADKPNKEEPIVSNNKIPAEGEFVSAADLYKFIYHHQKKLNPNQNQVNDDQNQKDNGVESHINQPQNTATNQEKKSDSLFNLRMNRAQCAQNENKIINAFDQANFQKIINSQNNIPKCIKSFSHANPLNLDSNKFINKTYNKFDFRSNNNNKNGNSEKHKDNSSNSEKENKRPNVIFAIIKPISIEEIFATDKKPVDINLPNSEIIKEIKDFLFDEKNEDMPLDKNEISDNQTLKKLMDLGITPKIEFRKQSADISFIKQPLFGKSEGQIKHFLGKKVDGSIARSLNISKESCLSNKFDVPLNKICLNRKFSHATTNETKSSPSSHKDSEESLNISPHQSAILDNEKRNEIFLADSTHKNEIFKKRRIDIDDLFNLSKKADCDTNKENIDNNLNKNDYGISKKPNSDQKSNVNHKIVSVQDLFS